MRQRDAKFPVHVPDEPGAVEAAARRGAAPDVRNAGQPVRDLDGAQAAAEPPLLDVLPGVRPRLALLSALAAIRLATSVRVVEAVKSE